MAKPRTKKTKKSNGDSRRSRSPDQEDQDQENQREYDKVITMRISGQEDSWLEELTKKHQARSNKSELVRMLIRKAAAEAGLQGA